MSSIDIFRLDGKRILITGASAGLGAHFAEVLVGAGASVILAGRRREQLEETASKVRALGGEALISVVDVSKEDSVEAAFAEMPLPDVVINNAGVHTEGAIHTLTEAQWQQVMDINLKGAWLCTRAAIRGWLNEKRPGNVINVASILGLRVQNQFPVYAASKAALIQLTGSTALDYARFNIRANALCPGYFATDLNREWLENSPPGERLRSRIPYRRPGEMSELNGPLLLLASDASSYMSGSTVVVDGAHLRSTL